MKTLNCGLNLPSGYIIRGRWEQRCYRIVRLLGSGGTGVAYLVRDRQGMLRAMKVSGDLTGITHEHRMLVYLNKLQVMDESKIIPKVWELDDFQIGDRVYHYFISGYCTGKGLDRLWGKLDAIHISRIGAKVAVFLRTLHRNGLVYGDLKPGNMVYDIKTGILHIIDFGSITVKGQCLRQYTPAYDRASWNAGTRLADERYDIFALGVLLSSLIIGKNAGTYRKKGLSNFLTVVNKLPVYSALKEVLIQSLNQETGDCGRIADALSYYENGIIMESSEVNAFVNIVAVLSLIAFIFSLAIY